MGKTPADIQREITLQRELIERRVRDLEDRVSDDVRDTGRAATHKVESAGETLDQKLHLSDQVEQRPFTVLLGALGAGFVLGMMSDRGGGAAPPAKSRTRDGAYRYDRAGAGDDAGMLSQLLGGASGFLGGTIGEELRGLVSDIFDDLRQNVRGQRAEPPETAFRSRYDRETYGPEFAGGRVRDGKPGDERHERAHAASRGNGAA